MLPIPDFLHSPLFLRRESIKTILENCLVGLEVTGKLNDDSKNYVVKLLKTYGLGDFMDKYPNSLSGGMRQRVGWI